MEKRGNENLRIVLDVVRKVTKAIKLFPFLYIVLFLIVTPYVAYGNFDVALNLSSLMYVSLLVVIFLIYLSYCVKLCKWHRIQCCLPLLPQITIFIDENIYEFGSEIALIDFITIAIIFILSLVNAYFVFIKPTIIYQSST